jgi:DNA-binding GntR family transcriptional regulator
MCRALAAGEFASMAGLVEILALPIAPTRDAEKRAGTEGLLEVLPKRGVKVMGADPETTRNCLDLRDLPRRAVVTDLTLHDALASGLDNPLAAEAYRANRNRIAVIQNSRPFLPDRIVPAMREHLAIIEALVRRDAEAAVAGIAEHCRLTLRWWGILV